jgi:60 kDa SS-A/Ro ribonucleoprotein
MTNYLRDALNTRQTPQTKKIPGSTQVSNSEGGYVWQVDDFSRLHRFLILGSEGGSYYAGEHKLTKENAEVVLRCIEQDGPRVVSIVREISTDGRAPKNDPAIFALALCTAANDEATRKAALEAIPAVCRIGTHLFTFAEFVEQFRGWGRGLRRAIGNWYADKEPEQLAYQLVKYRQRNGWSHRDTLRLAHPIAEDIEHKLLYDWTVTLTGQSEREHTKLNESLPPIIHGFEAAQAAKTPKETAALVREYGLPREALQTEHLNDNEVWQAMLDAGMPMTALVRNLATMSKNGLLTNTSDATTQVVAQLKNGEAILKSKIHPLQVLAAALTYSAGRSIRGSATWSPAGRITDALDEAFYLSFGNVEPTGKRRLIAFDVSASMTWDNINGVPGLTPRVASSAMALVAMKTGDPYEVVAFSAARSGGWGSSGIEVIDLSPRQRLNDVVRQVDGLYAGRTDCSLPMQWADQSNREFDVIEIYTDSETYAGTPHPAQALANYRAHKNLDTKLVVYGMVSNGFSIADDNDPGMLDVVGFDTAVPNLVAAFIDGGF